MNTIEEFVNAGGMISFGYKKNMSSWVSDVRLAGNTEDRYIILSEDIDLPRFKTFTEAFAAFQDRYLSYKNLWFVLRSLEQKGLYNLENLDRDVDSKSGKICDDEDGRALTELIKQETKLLKGG